MIDMPELLLRMKIGASYSLDELNKIFNSILNHVANPNNPFNMGSIAALAYFPHVFASPRDEYVTAMLYEMATDTSSDDNTGIESILAFTGNVHVKPAKRLWGQVCKNGQVADTYSGAKQPHKPIMKPKSVLLKN